MDPSESVVETPCSSFNLPAAGSPLSTSNSSTCNSCSYIRHHQRRRSRRAPVTATNPITDGDSNCNANIIRDSTATMMIMRLKQDDEAVVEEELPQQVIMSNSPPCDLMMLSGGATAQELQSEEEEDEQDGDLMGNRRKRRVNTERSRCSVVSSSSTSSSSHIFPSSTTSTKFYHTSSSSSSRTALLFTFLSVALLMLAGTGSGVDGLRINQFGGYEDVVVSVGSDVPPITCQQLIQNLQVCNITLFCKIF